MGARVVDANFSRANWSQKRAILATGVADSKQFDFRSRVADSKARDRLQIHPEMIPNPAPRIGGSY